MFGLNCPLGQGNELKMMDARKILLKMPAKSVVALKLVNKSTWAAARSSLSRASLNWAVSQNFTGIEGTILHIGNEQGEVSAVFVGADKLDGGYGLARLSKQLPPGVYRFEGETSAHTELAWCLEAYSFDRYKTRPRDVAQLVCSKHINYEAVIRQANATYFVRDMINTPANDFGPDELEAAARKLANTHKAKFQITRGAALQKNFPMVHDVGKASPRAPRLIDFIWGPVGAPKVTLVGKGVCFDTGGLDIKPASGMAIMKKDMGGAANVLGLAQMIMESKLPVRLRVIIPAVENSIAGNAFRPGDVLKSRKGLTVEIGNTDAEGRLVLGDALSLADEEQPDLLIDVATLTGAARVALGPELPPFYTDDEKLAADIAKFAVLERDPLWRMPLWEPYNALFDSGVADINNSGDSGFAGSITAALFLKRFVEKAKSYVHFDIYGWVPSARPGSPKGGEAQGIRALFAVIADRYHK
jgi:leucyl aminopeptidase